jgi:hypothetical protein
MCGECSFEWKFAKMIQRIFLGLAGVFDRLSSWLGLDYFEWLALVGRQEGRNREKYVEHREVRDVGNYTRSGKLSAGRRLWQAVEIPKIEIFSQPLETPPW